MYNIFCGFASSFIELISLLQPYEFLLELQLPEQLIMGLVDRRPNLVLLQMLEK